MAAHSNWKRICLIAPLLAAAMLGACAKHGGKEQPGVSGAEPAKLTVRYDPTQYGGDWLQKTADAYMQKYGGSRVELIADEKIGETMAHAFSTGGDVPDIAILPQTNWQAYAARGWLADLTPLRDAQVEGKALRERLRPGFESFGVYDGKWRVLPLSDGVSGILYNEAVFSAHDWEPPQTQAELFRLLPLMREAGITPFVWPGKQAAAWNDVTLSWWAQSEGEPGVSTFLAMKDPSVYRQQGRLDALQSFESVVGEPENSRLMPEQLDSSSAFSSLCRGRAAMMPGASWMARRYRNLLQDTSQIRILRAPAPDNARDALADEAAAGDFLCIPAASQDQEAAKQFLLFLARDESTARFFSATDTPAAINGVPAASLDALARAAASQAASSSPGASAVSAGSKAAEGAGASSGASSAAAGISIDGFTQSVLEQFTGSRRFVLLSKKPVYYNNLLDWPGTGMPFMQIYLGRLSAQEAFDQQAVYAIAHWSGADTLPIPSLPATSSSSAAP